MAIQFTKAAKRRARLRLNIEGQPNGGKTYSSILLAKFLIGEPFKLSGDVGSKILVIDTERSSAELYADEFDFLHYNLTTFSPKAYVEAIHAAEEAGAEVVIVDGISLEWKFCLAEVDRIKPKFGGNKWSAWSEVRPQHDDFIDTILGCRCHIIATTRAKPATAQDQENGRTKIVQVGLEGVQDDFLPFNFTIVLRMDGEHNAVVTKTRCRALDGKVWPFPGEALANVIKNWLESGEAEIEIPHKLEDAIRVGVAAATTGATSEIRKAAYGTAKTALEEWCKGRARSPEETEAAVATFKTKVTEALNARRAAGPSGGPGTPIDPDAAHAAAIDAGRA